MVGKSFAPVVLFGSGETSRAGGRVFAAVAEQLSAPLRVAVLETPAGFEPNSALVAGRVGDFIRQRLQNLASTVSIIPARKRGTPFSPDDSALTRPLLEADLIFLGPGSPTYAVRQLQNSLAWHRMVARQRLGAPLVLASAAVLAFSALTLPVYEIYKVGADLHWQPGLDFFASWGLPLVFVPHWNNAEGGAFLDTGRCFMGQERFARLLALLPAELTVVGIDEQTALLLDPTREECRVLGAGGVTLLRSGEERHRVSGETFALAELGSWRRPAPAAGLPPAVWEEALAAQASSRQVATEVPPAIASLVEQRQRAREERDWRAADTLRQQIAGLGWQVDDTPHGPLLKPAVSPSP